MKIVEGKPNILNKQPRPVQREDKVNEAAKGMEKIFLKHLVDELRKSSEKVDIFGKKSNNDFFENELYGEYVEKAVDRGDLGLAKMIKQYINKANGLK